MKLSEENMEKLCDMLEGVYSHKDNRILHDGTIYLDDFVQCAEFIKEHAIGYQNKESEKQKAFTAELDKTDVINMLRGTSPYSNRLHFMGVTNEYGGICDKSEWKRADDDCWKHYSIYTLFELYKNIKADEMDK